MGRKLEFGIGSDIDDVEDLELWVPQGRAEPVLLYVLADGPFDEEALKYGYEPQQIGGFAVWGENTMIDVIYLRHNRLDLLVHEWRHIEEAKDYHESA